MPFVYSFKNQLSVSSSRNQCLSVRFLCIQWCEENLRSSFKRSDRFPLMWRTSLQTFRKDATELRWSTIPDFQLVNTLLIYQFITERRIIDLFVLLFKIPHRTIDYEERKTRLSWLPPKAKLINLCIHSDIIQKTTKMITRTFRSHGSRSRSGNRSLLPWPCRPSFESREPRRHQPALSRKKTGRNVGFAARLSASAYCLKIWQKGKNYK